MSDDSEFQDPTSETSASGPGPAEIETGIEAGVAHGQLAGDDPTPDEQPPASAVEHGAPANDFGIPGVAEAFAQPAELDDVEPAAIEQAGDEELDTPFDKLATKAKRLSPERVRTILEALLFVTDKPLSEEAIRQCTGLELPLIKQQLHKLQGSYRDGVRGIVLHEVSGGWQFRTDPGTSEFVRRFLKVKPQRLTRAALETLAIIAYRQPVTRPEIEDIRAVDSGAVLKALLERHLIKIIGKRDEVGRPLLYGTSSEFLEFFNLRDLGSLPTLREFQELSAESQAVVEEHTGSAEPVPTTANLVAELKDSAFEKKLAETNAEADAALAELEDALAETDEKARETDRVLNPKPAPVEAAPDGAAGERRQGEGGPADSQ